MMKPWIIRKIQGMYRDLRNSATPVTLPRFFQLVKIQLESYLDESDEYDQEDDIGDYD